MKFTGAFPDGQKITAGFLSEDKNSPPDFLCPRAKIHRRISVSEDKNSPPKFCAQGQKFTAGFLCPRTKIHRRIFMTKGKNSPPNFCVRGQKITAGLLCPRTKSHRRICLSADRRIFCQRTTIQDFSARGPPNMLPALPTGRQFTAEYVAGLTPNRCSLRRRFCWS